MKKYCSKKSYRQTQEALDNYEKDATTETKTHIMKNEQVNILQAILNWI